MSVDRYFAELALVPRHFQSSHRTGWLLFDRGQHDAHGAASAIAFCVSRPIAFELCKSMNTEAQQLIEA